MEHFTADEGCDGRRATHDIIDSWQAMELDVGQEHRAVVGFVWRGTRAQLARHMLRDTVLGEVSTLCSKLPVTVKDTKEGSVGISTKAGDGYELVLVEFVGSVWVIASLRDVGISDGVASPREVDRVRPLTRRQPGHVGLQGQRSVDGQMIVPGPFRPSASSCLCGGHGRNAARLIVLLVPSCTVRHV